MATARYTAYEPEWVPITLRFSGSVSEPMTGPRSCGLAAPHWMGTGGGPWPPGCEVSLMYRLGVAYRSWIIGYGAMGAAGIPWSS